MAVSITADPCPELRAQIDQDKAVVQPQIRGLHDWATVSIGQDLRQAIASETVVRERRMGLLQAVTDQMDHLVNALNNLAADGYPALPEAQVPESLMAELREESADVIAAAGVFTAQQASSVTVKFAEPTPKPKS